MRALRCICFSLLTGCATLPKDFPAKVSTAIPQSETTTLGNLLKDDVASHQGLSGFSVLNTGRQAYLARLALADTAERTIDCQYYIWNGDSCGVILLQRLLSAANRGVRVRLLLDDMTSHGKDLGLAALNKNPNIEVRLFNPLGRRYYFGLFRTMSLAFHAGRMTNRMHNKIFVADNQIAIVGGRNIADEYFGVDKRSNFRDLDLASAGPIVGDISHAFDEYWNSPWSVPFEVFKTKLPSQKKYEQQVAKIEKQFKKMQSEFPYPLDWSHDHMISILSDSKKHLIWSEAHVVVDPPGKAWQKAHRGTSASSIANELEGLVKGANKDILIVSPYFILSPENVQKMGNIVRRGVTLRLFTNSLRSTDAVPVVAMYRKIRKPMLEQGVKIFEMHPDAVGRLEQVDASVAKARFSLHAKAVVFDRKTVFVGTFNIDPRSEYLNTEVGLVVNSPELADDVASFIEKDIAPTNSYQVHLTDDKKSVRWSSEESGVQKEYSSDPHAGPWLRFEAWFLALLPISHQL